MNKYAYIAGLLDGDGYFGITKIRSRYKTGFGFQYKTRIIIANCNLVLLEKVKELFGGFIVKKRMPVDKNWTQGYNLQIGYIRKWLPKVIPHIIGKKKKAQLLLEASALLDDRHKRTNTAGKLHTERLDVIMNLLRKKEWLI